MWTCLVLHPKTRRYIPSLGRLLVPNKNRWWKRRICTDKPMSSREGHFITRTSGRYPLNILRWTGVSCLFVSWGSPLSTMPCWIPTYSYFLVFQSWPLTVSITVPVLVLEVTLSRWGLYSRRTKSTLNAQWPVMGSQVTSFRYGH